MIFSAMSCDLRRNLAKTSPLPFSFLSNTQLQQTDHELFSQLGEVVRKAGPIGDVVFLVIVIDVDGGDCCAGIDVFDLGEEGGKASHEVCHPLVLGAARQGDRQLNNWPRRK
jgi:hypothetical protein